MNINLKDLIIDTYSNNNGIVAIRITHKPTGKLIQYEGDDINMKKRDELINKLNEQIEDNS